ncbi:hypothetical protein CEXT_76191 [Caerostris extrusa]|uniref:Uncharacterized protein n=1 Tax=Caerostris extrusa TaxID=172846 RepID=A0AAV4PA05_CAEEX|nr:hypothetical protein CEXT_76191 [Caerostris extrusa]
MDANPSKIITIPKKKRARGRENDMPREECPSVFPHPSRFVISIQIGPTFHFSFSSCTHPPHPPPHDDLGLPLLSTLKFAMSHPEINARCRETTGGLLWGPSEL